MRKRLRARRARPPFNKMFEGITENLSKALRNLRGLGKLTDENMAEALGEVRKALLSADVHFKVARDFTERVRAECVGLDVVKSVTPGQQIVKIISDELVKLLGAGETELSPIRPLGIMMVGLHGSGKTTTSAKLAALLRRQGMRPALVACDVYRPAAIDQLEILGRQIGVPVYSDRNSRDVPEIGERLGKLALQNGANAVIFDTAGRLHVDEVLMQELSDIKKAVNPTEILLVVDSMTGQDAVNVAESFNELLDITGVILTKLDGDTRGGAALSVRYVTGKPIKFVGTGEKLDMIEPFYPDRMASRILGMGDVLSLIEKAEQSFDQKKAEEMEKKLREASFTLTDYLEQFRQIKNMGNIKDILAMLPGMSSAVKDADIDDRALSRTEAIILSMTVREREHPEILNASRKKRVAAGSGTSVEEVNRLLKQYEQMNKMMKQFMGNGRKGKKGRMKLPFRI